MDIFLSNADSTPIYRQISTQIKNQIISGALAPGELLPSIRGLAKDLRISVITTKRAYDDLEAEGLLCNVPGKGCFVSEQNTELIREGRLREIEAHLEEAARLAGPCGLNTEELEEMLHLILEEHGS